MSAWIIFEEIKKTVSLEMVLHHYRIELRSVGTGTLRGKCPLPMHGTEHKNRASFTATLTKGVGGVWACQSASCIKARDGKKGGNALDFVATMEHCTIRDAAGKLADWFRVLSPELPGNTATHETKPVRSDKPVSKEKKPEADGERNKPMSFELQGIEFRHPYLESRGVGEDLARKFGIGYFGGRGSMHGRIVFPIHNEGGDLIAYAGRSTDDTEPRYKFPAGFHKSLELYNLHRALGELNSRRRVVIVEGFFDCLNVHLAGFPCVALMGSSMSKAQEELIARHFNVACILLDDDEAGQEGAVDCLARLGRRIWTWAPALPAGKQPDMLTIEEIQTLLKK